jgi:hypothetical protein
VDQAEEQPAKIVAIQRKEPKQKKKYAGKKIWWMAIGRRRWPGEGGFWFRLWFWL